jgi:hypothetical protein
MNKEADIANVNAHRHDGALHLNPRPPLVDIFNI